MIIEPTDINCLWGGFHVEKIKKLSDAQLQLIEQRISGSIDSVSFANVEEYRYLSVSWSQKNSTTDAEKIKIAEIINEIIKDL
jgi:hypothetical protein